MKQESNVKVELLKAQCCNINVLIKIGSFPVHASQTVGKVFGGEQVFITGPQFEAQDTINCIFGDVVTDGYFISQEKCLCIAPEQYNDGIVQLVISITRGSAVLTGATKYRYSKNFIDVKLIFVTHSCTISE